MTDALWNGLIGAGGAAICCAFYYGYKGIVYCIKKKKMEQKAEIKSETIITGHNVMEGDIKQDKKITITIPNKKAIFTKKNLRAFLFIILSATCISFAVEMDYYWSPNYQWMSFEGDFYAYTVSLQRDNIDAINHLANVVQDGFSYLFWFLGILSFIIGITGFSFKKQNK